MTKISKKTFDPEAKRKLHIKIKINRSQLELLLALFDAGGEFGVAGVFDAKDKDYSDLVNKKLVKKLTKDISPRASLTKKGEQLIKAYAKKHNLLEF